MQDLDRAIRRVGFRLRVQRFLSALVWTLAAGLVGVAILIGTEKVLGRTLITPVWLPWLIAAASGLVLAAAWSWWTGPSRLDAALAIDHAFGLSERLSTVLSLPRDLLATPAGHALMEDARHAMDALDVRTAFALRLPKRAWIPLIPGLLAVGLLFAPANLVQARERRESKPLDQAEKKVISEKMKSLAQTIKTQRKELEKQKLTETDKILAQIEQAAEKLEKAPPATKDKAMVELNKLTDALKERQKQIGTTEQLAKQLQMLKEMTSEGPADDFAKEMARGDFAKAAEQLKQLREKMQSGKMTEQEKKELAAQMQDMKKKLDELSNLQERRKQLEEAKNKGTISEEQYQQQMAKLDQQMQQMKQLQKMTEQLAQAQQAMQQGDMQKAADALGMSQSQLEQMARDLAELETLDQSLAELQDAKNGMAGDGMNQLGRGLDGMNQFGMRDGQGNTGQGLGRGRGQGDRPEAPDSTNTYNTKVRPEIGKGKAILEGFGPYSKQVRGLSSIEIQETVEAASEKAAEALSNQKIPGSVRKHVQGYFDQIRRGERRGDDAKQNE